MAAGLFAVILGFMLNVFYDKLGWLGRLPGDIRLGSDNVRFYFAFTTLVIINIIIYLIMRLIAWLK